MGLIFASWDDTRRLGTALSKCVIRYDNEAGKADHRHIGESEKAYRFIDLDQLMADFERDIARWQDENGNA